MDGSAGGSPLNCPLMPAPDTSPTTGCGGRPLPLRTSCLVLAGRSPGLEEPPLYNRVPSPVTAFSASFTLHLSFSTLTFFLFYSSSLMCSLSCFLCLPFSYSFCYHLVSFYHLLVFFLCPPIPKSTVSCFNPLLPPIFISLTFLLLCTSHLTTGPVCKQFTSSQCLVKAPCQGYLPPPVRCCLTEATLRSVLQKKHLQYLLSVSCYKGLVDITAFQSDLGGAGAGHTNERHFLKSH